MLLSSWNDIVEFSDVATAQASMGFSSDAEIVSVLIFMSLAMLVLQVGRWGRPSVATVGGGARPHDRMLRSPGSFDGEAPNN